MPPTVIELQAWAYQHAERAHELLARAETELAGVSGSQAVPPALGVRVTLAQAHAHCSLALSAAIVPFVAQPPPPTPTPAGA